MPAIVSYPGGCYHTSCVIYAHTQLTRSASAPAKWVRLLTALAGHDAPVPGSDTQASPLLAGLERILARGDPGLDPRLLDTVARPYGASAGLLELPDFATADEQHAA